MSCRKLLYLEYQLFTFHVSVEKVCPVYMGTSLYQKVSWIEEPTQSNIHKQSVLQLTVVLGSQWNASPDSFLPFPVLIICICVFANAHPLPSTTKTFYCFFSEERIGQPSASCSLWSYYVMLGVAVWGQGRHPSLYFVAIRDTQLLIVQCILSGAYPWQPCFNRIFKIRCFPHYFFPWIYS